MRRTSSLQLLMTLNALLLGALIWIVIADRPASPSAFARGGEAALPDAASQRLEMIRELEKINASMKRLNDQVSDLRKKPVKVEVVRMPGGKGPDDPESE